MGTPYLSEIRVFSFGFAPKGWAMCNGQLMAINQNQALFALLGTTYGGNGVTTFALPNLQSRLPVHMGGGFTLGQTGGETAHTLNTSELPAHAHAFSATTASATSARIANTLLPAAPTAAGASLYAVSQSSPNPALTARQLAVASCGVTGGNQPHTNLMPALALNICIALQGIFPSQT